MVTRALVAAAALAMMAAAQEPSAQKPAGREPAAQEPVALFDGASLDGWTRRGGSATYRAEDGAIVGRSGRYPNAFLCTDRTFGDFELDLDFRVQPGMNSGVQVRSEARKRGAVFGYQVEIDPSDRAWTGGIYDESRRGWLDDLTDSPAARAAFRQGDWNHFRIVCDGPSLRTWINGVPAADLLDVATVEGFVGLQVHGMAEGAPSHEVRWRDLRLVDHGRHVWQPLFDRESLGGFEAIGGGTWKVEDGVLIGEHAQDDPAHGVLLADGTFDDLAVRVVYRAVKGNSGLYFRCEPKPDSAVVVHGFQAEIDAAKDAGMLYETGGRARVQVPAAEWVAEHFKPGDWNEMVVIAQGRRVKVLVNGAVASELRDDPGRLSGRLGLQLHGGQDMRVELRSLEILRRAPAPRGDGG